MNYVIWRSPRALASLEVYAGNELEKKKIVNRPRIWNFLSFNYAMMYVYSICEGQPNERWEISLSEEKEIFTLWKFSRKYNLYYSPGYRL